MKTRERLYDIRDWLYLLKKDRKEAMLRNPLGKISLEILSDLDEQIEALEIEYNDIVYYLLRTGE